MVNVTNFSFDINNLTRAPGFVIKQLNLNDYCNEYAGNLPGDAGVLLVLVTMATMISISKVYDQVVKYRSSDQGVRSRFDVDLFLSIGLAGLLIVANIYAFVIAARLHVLG